MVQEIRSEGTERCGSGRGYRRRNEEREKRMKRKTESNLWNKEAKQ
jgi:hypothetical protein